MGTQLGRNHLRAGFVGRPIGFLGMFCFVNSRQSLCDGSGESRQKARRKLERGLMPNEHVMADAKRAFQVRAVFP